MAPGITYEARHLVTKAMSPGHLPVDVLSTPSMISYIEAACSNAAEQHLDGDEATVGTHVCVSHDDAVLEGREFIVRCRLASVVKRRLNFEVEVDGPDGQVSRGTHQRAVVDPSRMGGAP